MTQVRSLALPSVVRAILKSARNWQLRPWRWSATGLCARFVFPLRSWSRTRAAHAGFAGTRGGSRKPVRTVMDTSGESGFVAGVAAGVGAELVVAPMARRSGALPEAGGSAFAAASMTRYGQTVALL